MIRCLALAFCFLILPTNILQADVLYGISNFNGDGSSSIIRIDNYDTNPVIVELFETGIDLYDIAYNPQTGEFYVLGEFRLYHLDMQTQALTHLGITTQRYNSFDIHTDGTAYVAGADSASHAGRFATIDLSNGSTSIIGPIGYAPAGDMMFDLNGDVLATTYSMELIEINKTTGAGSLIGPTNIDSPSFGADMDSNGVIYASGFPGNFETEYKLYTLDPITGDATFIDSIGNSSNYGINGMVFVSQIPEPSFSWILIFGCTLALRRKRSCVFVH